MDPLILSHLQETLLATACHSGRGLKEDRALNTVLSHCFEVICYIAIVPGTMFYLNWNIVKPLQMKI